MFYERKVNNSILEKKRLQCGIEIKSFDAQGRFAGYASVFHVLDNQNDIILPGAFKDTLEGRLNEIKLLWQHRPDEPIGTFTQIFEDANGLYVEGRLQMEVARADEAYTLLKSGAVNGLSIGYSPLKYSVDPVTGVRTLYNVQLWEVSLVTFPANQAAGVTVVKGANNYAVKDNQKSSDELFWMMLQGELDRAIGVLQD